MSEAPPTVAAPPRDAAPRERTWDAESVFPHVAAWEDELAAVLEEASAVARFAGRLHESPETLVEALAAREALEARAARVFVYAMLAYSVDTTNTEAVERVGRAQSMRGAVVAALAFYSPELLALGRETVEGWASSDERLAVYRHHFDDLFRLAAHVRDAQVEEILGLVSDPFSTVYDTYSALVDSDLRFRPATGADGAEAVVTQSTVETMLAGGDRELRRSAWESFADGFLGFRNTLTMTLQAAVKQEVFEARVRGYESTLAASLARANVPVAAFESVLATFRENLPTWHRYWEVRRRVLGLDAVAPYDVWAPIGPPVDVPYEQAVDWICAALAPLGDEYVETMRRGCLEERWVDSFPNVGKAGGAFSAGTPGTHPFIVMSYDGTSTALGTLAHELGHSMHSYLAWKTQPLVYADYSLFVAEVASNFNQAMLRAYLLETVTDRALRLAVLDEAFANFHRYLFVMPILAGIERELHARIERGDGVSAPALGELTADRFAEGFGPDVELDRERMGVTWAQFGHLYAPFYVYQYTTGIAGAQALARRILAGEEGAAERYLAFLSAGGSRYPVDALRAAGVDLSAPEPVVTAFETLSSLVDELDELA